MNAAAGSFLSPREIHASVEEDKRECSIYDIIMLCMASGMSKNIA